MTYCVGVLLNDGIVLASDSRTHAGVDNFATFCKMTVFETPGERAITLYQQLMKAAPEHSYADDAALREADVYDTLGDKENATAVLSSFPQRFPKGDQLGEALAGRGEKGQQVDQGGRSVEGGQKAREDETARLAGSEVNVLGARHLHQVRRRQLGPSRAAQ